MNLSKRIALSSTVILIFFFCTVLVFIWSNELRREKIDELQSTIRSQYLISDVSKEEDCKSTVEHTVSKYGKVDILFNNAGYFYFFT